MPTVQRYENISVNYPDGRTPRLPLHAGGLGSGLESLAGAFDAVVDAKKRIAAEQEERDARTWVTTVGAEAERNWTERFTRETTDRDPTAIESEFADAGPSPPSVSIGAQFFDPARRVGTGEGFSGRLAADVEAWAKTVRGAAPNARAAELIEPRIEKLKTHLFGKALDYEVSEKQAERAVSFHTAMENHAKTVLNDPDRFDDILGRALSDLDDAKAVWMGPKAYADQRQRLLKRLPEAAMLGRIQRDPEAAHAALVAGTGAQPDDLMIELLDVTQREQLSAKARSLADHRQRVAAAEFAPLLKDHLASLERTGTGVPGLSFRVASALPPEKLADFRRDEALALETFHVTSRVRFAPPEAVAAELERLKPAPGSTGFADRQRAFDHLTVTARRMMAERAKDPAGYAMQAPEIVSAFRAAAGIADIRERDATYARALTARMEFQRSIGIAEPKLFSEAEAQETVRKIHGTSPADSTHQFVAMVRSWGPLAPLAMQELNAKGLDTRYMVLASIGDNLVASADLANAIRVGRTELHKSVDPADKTKIREGLRRHTQQFKSLFEATSPRPEAIRQMNDILATVEDMAIYYARRGQDPAAAAADAYAFVIGDRYHLIRSESIRAYVPKSLGDPEAIRLAARDMQDEAAIRAFDPRPFVDPGAPEFLNVERTVRTAANSGFWVTDGEQGTSMVLMVPFRDGAVLPLVNKRGELYRIPFADPPLTPTNRARLLERGAMP